MVTVIARSSVNVNNGGSNRSSNFVHAFFLVVFILLFGSQLSRIPMPALMAILVYTGYKLASPTLVRKIFSVGKEQLLIFFVTLLITLFINLITGIAAGVLVTFIIHVIMNKSIALFFRNVLKPNVLMYQEPGPEGNYYVSVKHFCSFLNFYKLKQKIEAIPEGLDVVVDFSLCEFVDHTVMENLNSYQDLFHKRGGHFEVIGLDLHGTDSKHPFALRRIITGIGLLEKNLTKRQSTLQKIADDYQMNYNANRTPSTQFLESFHYFNSKKIEAVYNLLYNVENTFRLFDINYSEGEFIAKENVRTTMLHIKLDCQVPEFRLDREGFLERVYAFAGFKDIPIENHNDFSKRFYLLGENEDAIKHFFDDDLVHFFESNPYYHVESNGAGLLVFIKERLAGIKEIKALYDFGKRLREIVR